VAPVLPPLPAGPHPRAVRRRRRRTDHQDRGRGDPKPTISWPPGCSVIRFKKSPKVRALVFFCAPVILGYSNAARFFLGGGSCRTPCWARAGFGREGEVPFAEGPVIFCVCRPQIYTPIPHTIGFNDRVAPSPGPDPPGAAGPRGQAVYFCVRRLLEAHVRLAPCRPPPPGGRIPPPPPLGGVRLSATPPPPPPPAYVARGGGLRGKHEPNECPGQAADAQDRFPRCPPTPPPEGQGRRGPRVRERLLPAVRGYDEELLHQYHGKWAKYSQGVVVPGGTPAPPPRRSREARTPLKLDHLPRG